MLRNYLQKSYMLIIGCTQNCQNLLTFCGEQEYFTKSNCWGLKGYTMRPLYMLKTRAGAVSSWLRREIATHLAQQEIHWCTEVASKVGIMSVSISASRRTDPAWPSTTAVQWTSMY